MGKPELFPIQRAAAISPCGKYRYSLSRVWDEGKGCVLWVMLNPSTADAQTDDHTITKCMGFARRWGYGGIHVANLFNWRATDPSELLKVPNPYLPGGVGAFWPDGTFALTVAAWGNVAKPFRAHAKMYLAELQRRGPVHCLKLTGQGWPWHPLYVPYDEPLKSYQHLHREATL